MKPLITEENKLYAKCSALIFYKRISWSKTGLIRTEFCHNYQQPLLLCCLISPYSPDMNPTELCFGDGKSWLHRHHDVCDKYHCLQKTQHNLINSYHYESHCLSKKMSNKFCKLYIQQNYMHLSGNFTGSLKKFLSLHFIPPHLIPNATTWTRLICLAH